MKPNFALTLSFEGIGLLHRAFPGWHLVGEVAFDDSEIATDLKALRDKALALDPSGLRTKLVIPNDQIRYIQFDVSDHEDQELDELVKTRLEGATPYDVDQLAYDWSAKDGKVCVAAVAKETLSEAEAFSNEHAFQPVSFVAIPENGDFLGEPFFGKAEFAEQLLDDGQTLERDQSAIRVIGAARLPDPEPATTPDENEIPVTVPEPQDANGSTASEQQYPEDMPEPEASPDNRLDVDTDHRPDEVEPDTSAPDTQVAAFASIRAKRDEVPDAAPRLEGVDRGISVPPAPAESDEPSSVDFPDFEAAGISDARLQIEPQGDEFETSRLDDERDMGSVEADTSQADADVFSTRRSPRADPRPISPPPRKTTVVQAEVATVFGARDDLVIGGKPRYLGLILTAVLLLFLVGVAAWASIFLDDGLARFFQDDQDQRTVESPDLPPSSEPNQTDDPNTRLASLPDPDAEIETGLEAALPQPDPAELTRDEARARYAATGVWQMAPQPPQTPSPGSLEDFYQTSIDQAVVSQDAIALPDVTLLLADVPPDAPGSPATAGTRFELDDRGLVIATRNGATTPDGILVFAGRPAVVPPPTPERASTANEAEISDEESQRLATLRPRTRPGDLVEQNERGNLSGRTKSELAALRPKLRPPSAQETAAAAQTTQEPFIDLDAVNQAVTQAVESEDQATSTTPQAVSASLKPQKRPRNFDSVVKRGSQPQSEIVAVSAAQKVAPRIPTTTSVAKQATQRNVLKMRKINLIGVYGTPNSRRALVRLSNGRYRKVKIGDRLDGGKVSAIGDHELRYRKSGRNVVLKMPKG